MRCDAGCNHDESAITKKHVKSTTTHTLSSHPFLYKLSVVALWWNTQNRFHNLRCESFVKEEKNDLSARKSSQYSPIAM